MKLKNIQQNRIDELSIQSKSHPYLSVSTTVIQPSHGWASLGLGELWEYRELFYLLVWRDIRAIYRQTALGIFWLFIRPIITMLLFNFVFSDLVHVPSDNLPYPLFSLSALLPWTFFSNAVIRAAGSLVQNMEIISKVYFPRMIISTAGVLSGLIDFVAAFIIFLVMMVIYQLPFRPEMMLLPVLVFITMIFALAVGLWLATISVIYRDVSFVLNFLLQALMYLSPVIYPVSLVPEAFRLFYQLNPMTGIIQGFRWALLGSEWTLGTPFWASLGIILVALVSGAFIFRRTERTIVDIL